MKYLLSLCSVLLLAVSYAGQKPSVLDSEFNPRKDGFSHFLQAGYAQPLSEKCWKKGIRRFRKNVPYQEAKAEQSRKGVARMDARILDKVIRNKKNYFLADPIDGGSVVYWDVWTGLIITHLPAANTYCFLVGRTRINGPEDYVFELPRTSAVNKKTQKPYFGLTAETLAAMEAATGTKLNAEESDWLHAYTAVLNENFHFFYGEPLADIGQFWTYGQSAAHLLGRFVPTRLFLQTDSNKVVKTIRQEYISLCLRLFNVLPPQVQKDVFKQLAVLPEDSDEKKKLLDDTARRLIASLPENREQKIERIVKELKNNRLSYGGSEREFAKLQELILESAFRDDLICEYIPSETDVMSVLVPHLKTKDQQLLAEVQAQIERLQTIYLHKNQIGCMIGRPLYDIDKAVKNRTIGAFAVFAGTCMLLKNGFLDGPVALEGDRVVNMMMLCHPYTGSCPAPYVKSFKGSQLRNHWDLKYMHNLIVGKLLPHKGVSTDAEKNTTAFTQAAFALSMQYYATVRELFDELGKGALNELSSSLQDSLPPIDVQKAVKKYTITRRGQDITQLSPFPVSDIHSEKAMKELRYP